MRFSRLCFQLPRFLGIILAILLTLTGTIVLKGRMARLPVGTGAVLSSAPDPVRSGSIWSVTNRGLYHSEDAGTSWHRHVLAVRDAEPQRVWAPTPGGPVFVSTLRHGLFRSADRGSLWAEVNHGLPHSIGAAVVAQVVAMTGAADGKSLYCAAEAEGIYRSDDSGLSWRPAFGGLPLPLANRTEPPLLAADSADPDRVYALLTVPVHSHLKRSLLFRSADRAQSWAPIKDLGRSARFETMKATRLHTLELEGLVQKRTYTDTLPARLPALRATDLLSLPSIPPEAPIAAPPDFDSQGVAVLHDDGSLILGSFDLVQKSLEFRPTVTGSYDVLVGAVGSKSDLGERVELGDDDCVYRTLPFAFKFYGQQYTTFFVNSNGSVSFGAGESSGYWSESAFTLGRPRIAPLWADLDPEAGDGVYVNATTARVVVTWQWVPAISTSEYNTFQLVLSPDGIIQFHYFGLETKEGITGISNGEQTWGLNIPFSSAPVWEALTEAPIYQMYSAMELNPLAVARRFYRSHEDDYDGLVIFGASDVAADIAGDAFAYSLGVRNDVRGTGQSIRDYGVETGSASRLQSIVNLNALSKYPQDMTERIGDLNHSVLSLIGEEWGHRFLAYVYYRFNKGFSGSLLGRDYDHWSYFLNSEASFMEGNEWRDEGNLRFTALDESRRYSRLDQYLMGLRPAGEVGPITLITQAQPIATGTIEALASTFGLSDNAIRDPRQTPGSQDRFRSFWVRLGSGSTSDLMSYSASYIEHSGHIETGPDPYVISTVEDLKYWWDAKPQMSYAILKTRDSAPCSRYFDFNTGKYTGDNITVAGTPREIAIEQIIESDGERSPAYGAAPTSLRHAFVLVVPAQKDVNRSDIDRIAAIRQGWESLYKSATENRGSVSTALRFGLSSVAETLTGNGGRAYASGGSEGTPVSTGFAALESSTPSVSGTLIMTVRANGKVVSEAAVPATEPVLRARCFAEISPAVNTGVGIAAPAAAAVITVELRDAAGKLVASGPQSLAAHNQMARFVRDLFPGAILPPQFKGSITVRSNTPIAVVALRTLLNEAGEFLITTEPVANLDSPPQANSLYLPQVAAGGGYTTDVLLVNPGSTALSGRLEFRDPDGRELDLGISGASGGNVPYRLEPDGSLVVTTNSISATPRTGFVIVRPDSPLRAPTAGAIFAFSQGGRIVATTGVPPAEPSPRIRVYVDRRNNHDAGVALVNPGTQPAALTVTAANLQGEARGTVRTFSLDPAHQTSLFASELVPDLPQGFRGTLLLESNVPVATMAMRSTNAADRFLLSTLPVLDLTRLGAASSLFFPHLADGGGYLSEFIILNPGAGSSLSGLKFFSSTGTPLPLVSR